MSDEEQDEGVEVEASQDIGKIFCFGDSLNYLKFDIATMKWTQAQFSDQGTFEGNLRYFGASFVPNRKIYLTGGCSVVTSVASSAVYAVDLWYITEKPIKKQSLKQARYGHQSQYLNGLVFVIGGFSHRDLPNEAPVTLNSCERLSVIDNTWQEAAPMGKERAFAASIVLDN